MGFSLPSFGGSGGGKAIDKSKVNENVVQTENSNVAASDSSNAFSLDSGASLNILDGGAIESAFRFARESLGLSERTVGKAQEAFETSLAQTLSVSESERTGGANRTLYIALAALAVFAFIKR